LDDFGLVTRAVLEPICSSIDQQIRVHAFCFMLGISLQKYVRRQAQAPSPGLPTGQLRDELCQTQKSGWRFNAFVEALSAGLYAPQFGRPSLLPGIYLGSLQKTDNKVR
jgi:hypothetical protein